MERALPSSGRLTHLDFMRVLAIFCVLFNHTGNVGFFLFPAASGLKQWLYCAISVLCTLAVPLFFMISGALLLGRDEPIGTVLKKRFLRFAGILAGISVLYWLYDAAVHDSSLDPGSFLTRLYSADLSVGLWYLYSYLSVMLMLPLLRRMARSMTNQEFIYLALLSLIFTGLIPMAGYLVFQDSYQINRHLSSPLFTAENAVFFLMGYYFEHRLPEKYHSGKVVLLGAALSALAVLLSVGMTLYRGRVMGFFDEGESQRFHKSLIAIPTYTLFLACKLLFTRVQLSPRPQRLLIILAGTTFGVFLLERILREQTVFLYYWLSPRIGPLPASLCWSLGALALGSGFVALLKRIPGLKALL